MRSTEPFCVGMVCRLMHDSSYERRHINSLNIVRYFSLLLDGRTVNEFESQAS